MAYERMNTYALISMLDVVFKLIFAFVLPYIPFDKLLIYGIFYLIVTALNFIFYYVYSKRNFCNLYLIKSSDNGIFKEMISFSGWNLCGTFACVAREQGLNLVLNLFFGPIVNAARGIAYQVSGALQSFVSNLSLAAKPQMVQSFATGDSNRTINLMYVMSKLSFIFLYILSVPVVLNIDYVLHLWLGAVVPKHSANFVVLVILTNFFNNLNAPLSNVVYATGKMKKYELTFSVINLLIIPFTFIALKFGAPPETAFIVYLIMSIFVQIGCLLVLRTIVILSLRLYVKKLLLPIIAVVVLTFPMIYGIHIILPCSIISIVAEYVIMTIFATIAFYFLVLDSTEKSFIKNILHKILKK
jgi:O-antigen/teichoic acid export membrane protein